jgi:uncharacterized membrane protein YesL
MVLLNLLWVLGCLPIVTIGVSTIAAYRVAMQMVEERDSGIVVPFFRAYRANFKQGLILSLILIFLCVAIVLDFRLFDIMEGNPVLFLIIGIIAAVLVMVHFFYVFPLVARYQNKIFWHLTNSRNIFVRYFVRSMICTLLVALECWLFFAYSWLLLFIGVFIGPVLIILTKSVFAMKIFRIIESEGGVISPAETDKNTESDGNMEADRFSENEDATKTYSTTGSGSDV